MACRTNDSQVASAVVSRGMSTSFPLCAVAMELSAQLEARGAELFLEWVPRGHNQEADRLADGRCEGFAPGLRVHADLRKIRWLVLNELLEAGAAFYRQAQDRKRRRGETNGGGTARPRKKLALRVREPW